MNDEWMCDECQYEYVPPYANPCCNCVDGNKFEPEEGREDNEP